jgi:hypothetical protein
MLTKDFQTLTEATTFANKKPLDTVLEIKNYDPKINHIQNESDNTCSD